jgi:hypothetical protein
MKNIIKCKLYLASSGSLDTDCLAIQSPSGRIAFVYPHNVNDESLIDTWKFCQGKLKGDALYFTRSEMEIILDNSITLVNSEKELPF